MSGSEPLQARSALSLRRVLTTGGLVIFAALTVVCLALGTLDDEPFWFVVASGCAVIAVVSLVDLVVINHRLRSRRAG